MIKLLKILKNIFSYLNLRGVQMCLVLLFTLVCYANTLGNGFAWDDRDFIFDWPQIKNSETGLPAYLSLPSLLMGDLPEAHRGLFRPIRSVFYLVSYSFFGENPLGYHIQALIVHLLIVLVIYLIVDYIAKKNFLALMVSALFAVHPVHTEAISFITASFDTIGILFFFMSFYFYLKSQEKQAKRNSYLIASILYGSVAFFTYEMTLVLPILIIFYDFCMNNYSFKKLSPKVNTYKYFFLVAIIYALVRFLIVGIGDRSDLGGNFVVIANQARVETLEIFIKYLHLLIWPTNLSISSVVPANILNGFLWSLYYIDPSYNLINQSANIVFLFPLIYTFLIILLGFFLLKKVSLLFFSFSWIFLSLLPAANILPQGAALAIRFLYIPSFGFALFVGLLFYYSIFFLSKQKNSFYVLLKYLVLVLFIAILISHSYLTIRRNFDWRDEKTFWLATINSTPSDLRPYRAMGKIYLDQKDYDTALTYFKRAFDINPEDAQNNSDMGVVYNLRGDPEEAIKYQNKALTIEPNYFNANLQLADVYTKQGEYDQAEESLKKVLNITGDNFEAYMGLGDIYFNQKKYTQAVENYNYAAKINSWSSLTQYKLGLTYENLSKFDTAEEAFYSSIDLNPKQAEAYKELADIYIKKGDRKTATNILNEGITQTGNQLLKEQLHLIIGNK